MIAAWDRAIRLSEPLPQEFARFHWCCIQNKSADRLGSGGDLSRYLYRPEASCREARSDRFVRAVRYALRRRGATGQQSRGA